MDEADEAEDFQSVGIKCRDALIALGKQYQDASWVGDLHDRPQKANFKGWGAIYAERLCDGRTRNYVKALVDKTWDLAVALQHDSNATPFDADLTLDATAHLIGIFSRLVTRKISGNPERCPRCESYRIDEDVEHDNAREGFASSMVCAACSWRSERTFTSWAEHFEDTRLGEYLAQEPTDIFDRLHREGRSPSEELESDTSTPPDDSGDRDPRGADESGAAAARARQRPGHRESARSVP